MRVGLLIYGSLETVSGGYLYDRVLVEHLRQCGDQVQIISLPWKNYLLHLNDNLSTRLFRHLASLDVDILLQDELNHPSLAWLNSRLKRAISYPLIAIVHHLRSSELRPAWQNNFYRRVERRYLATLDGLVYNSQTTRATVESLLTRPIPYTVAYPAGNRLDAHILDHEIEQRAVQSGPLRLVFLGNLIERKGLHTLLEACRRLGAREWRLDIVGRTEADPAYTRRIRQMVAAYGLGGQVQLHGNPGDAVLTGILRNGHLLAVPSSYEGFGIVYLEGMGFGLPGVATTAGAAGEIITNESDGMLVEPENPVALCQALASLADDRRKLAAMGIAARHRYLQHPTWEQSAARIRDFLFQAHVRHHAGNT